MKVFPDGCSKTCRTGSHEILYDLLWNEYRNMNLKIDKTDIKIEEDTS